MRIAARRLDFQPRGDSSKSICTSAFRTPVYASRRGRSVLNGDAVGTLWKVTQADSRGSVGVED